MKLALVMVPEEVETCNLVTHGPQDEPPKVMVLGQRAFTFLLLALLLCTAALVIGTFLYTQNSLLPQVASLGSRSQHEELVPVSATTPLKRGDRVILKSAQPGRAEAGTIAAAPYEMVLLKQNGSLQALYLLGAHRYLVDSPGEPTRIVRTEEIDGVLAGAAVR